MEQGNSPASIFLGKVGVGLFYESLKAHRFKPYDFVFIILEEDDPIKGRSFTSRKAPGPLSVFMEAMNRRLDFMKSFWPILRTRDLPLKALHWK